MSHVRLLLETEKERLERKVSHYENKVRISEFDLKQYKETLLSARQKFEEIKKELEKWI